MRNTNKVLAFVAPLAMLAPVVSPAQAASQSAGPGAITSGVAGKCADDLGNAAANGTIVDLYDCNGGAAQQWTVPGDGTVRINGKCMDVTGQATANGSRVELWGYNSGQENSYQPVGNFVQELVTCVSRDGNFLLNIGPKGDGSVTNGSVTILQGLASWMSTYGDSVHGAAASPFATDPSWGRATTKDGKLFAHVFTWPSNGVLQIPAITNTINRVYLMNNPSTSLAYTVAGGQINVTLPSSAPDANDSVVCLEVSGVPTAAAGSRVVVYQDVDYAAASAVLPLGSYTSAQLSAAGIGPSAISSLRVPAGFSVTGYSGDDFTGTAWTFTADNADLRVTGNNDAIASVKVTFNPSTYFRLINVTDGLALDSGGNVASGSNLKQWTPVDSTNLQWQAVDLGNGYHKLVNRTNGMVADGWGSTANGAPAQQAPGTADHTSSGRSPTAATASTRSPTSPPGSSSTAADKSRPDP